MKVIFVNRFFYPDHSATSQMLTDLCFALATRGYEVLVVTSRLSYDTPGRRLPSKETVRCVTIYRVPTTGFGRAGLVGRAVDYATFYFVAAFQVLWLARPNDVVVSKTDPPALGVITGFAARLRGARRVNWLQDLFPEVALALGFGQRTIAGAMFGATKWLRDRSLRTADINIVLGARMKDRITKIVGSQSSTVEIPNWADGDVLKPTPHEENALRRAWSLTDAFVVSYSGNLGRAHDISTFVEAMVELQRGSDDATGPRVQWLFIGGGQQFEKLKTEVIDRDITNVLFQPYQPRERLAESLSAGDVHLISLRPELEGCIVPSKYYGVAAVGRPAIFVGSADGEIAHMLAQTGAGLTVEQGQGRALAAAILTLAHNPERAEQAGRAARAAFVHDYAFEHALEKWDAVLSGGVVPSMFSLDPSSATLDEAPRVEACE